jgi:hypothetical protein
MSGLNASTPDFIPGAMSFDAPASGSVNPFLKIAAKEFVPSAPAFIPGVVFGSQCPPFVPTFTPGALSFHPPSHVQNRSGGKKEGDDMSLSEACCCCCF